jgi:hypothetical protein
MKRVMMTAVSAALLVATAGAGQAAQVLINLSADVDPSCQVANDDDDPLQSTLHFNRTLDVDQDGTVDQTLQTVSFFVACNDGATATLTSLNGGLSNPTQPAAGQVNVIDYTAQITGAIATSVGSTEDDPQTGSGDETLGSATGTFSGDATVTITPVATPVGNTLVAGSYADTLRLTILP